MATEMSVDSTAFDHTNEVQDNLQVGIEPRASARKRETSQMSPSTLAAIRFPGLNNAPPDKPDKTQEPERQPIEPAATPPQSRMSRVNDAGAGQPPNDSSMTAGTLDGGDRELIVNFARRLLKGELEDMVPALVDALSDSIDDAPLQHAFSFAVIERMLNMRGVSFVDLIALPDLAVAQSRMLTALMNKGRFIYPAKEGVEEAIWVLNFARSLSPLARDVRGTVIAYLERSFEAGVAPGKIAVVADAIMSTGRPHAIRQVAHLARFASGLVEQGLTLGAVLKMDVAQAGERACHVMMRPGQPGVAGFETFMRLYAADHPEAFPDENASSEPSASAVNPDVAAMTTAREVALEVYRQSLDVVMKVIGDNYGLAIRDVVTQAYDGRHAPPGRAGPVERSIAACIDYVAKTGDACQCFSGDIINLSGLNKQFDEIKETANEHIRAIYTILVTTLGNHAHMLVPYRTGGDEYEFIAVGMDEAAAEEASTEGLTLVDQYVREHHLDTMEATKTDAQPGFGWHLAHVPILPDSRFRELNEALDAGINESKERRKRSKPMDPQ